MSSVCLPTELGTSNLLPPKTKTDQNQLCPAQTTSGGTNIYYNAPSFPWTFPSDIFITGLNTRNLKHGFFAAATRVKQHLINVICRTWVTVGSFLGSVSVVASIAMYTFNFPKLPSPRPFLLLPFQRQGHSLSPAVTHVLHLLAVCAGLVGTSAYQTNANRVE